MVKFALWAEDNARIRGIQDAGAGWHRHLWEGLQIRFLIGYHTQNALGDYAYPAAGDRPHAIKGLKQSPFVQITDPRGAQTIIQDCYNANPDSTKAALNFLNTLPWQGRKLAVLGSMLELGAKSREAHRELGSHVHNLKLDAVFLFGEEMEAAYHWLQEHNGPGNFFWTTDFNRLLTTVRISGKKAI
jgi:hypothetical protein